MRPTHLLIMLYLSVKVVSFCEVSLKLLQKFFSYCCDTILTSDLIATLTLGVGTKIMWPTHLLIMLYLSVKFNRICFSSLGATIYETRFVMGGWTDEWCDFNMPPKVPSGHKKYVCFRLYGLSK